MNSTPALEVEDLRVRYGTDIALENVTFQVKPGERIAVVGPNGAGKSTLLQAVAGLLQASRGKIRITGEQRNGPIAFLPQRPSIDWKFPLTVLDAVALGLKIKGRGAARKAAADALELVRLSEHAHRRISHLSGGQQQRLLIARALAMRSDLLLMDEPLSGLDRPARDNLFECLDELRDHDVSVMMALHDLNLASTLFQRAILLNRKIIADGNPVDIFTETNLVRTYGSHLHVVRIEGGTVLISDTCCEGRDE